MTNISRGHRAKELLADPLIEEALSAIEQVLQESWITAKDTSVREELWYTLQGCIRFKAYLEIAVETGEYELALQEKEDG